MEATCGFDIRVSPFFNIDEFRAKIEGFVASQPGYDASSLSDSTSVRSVDVAH